MAIMHSYTLNSTTQFKAVVVMPSPCPRGKSIIEQVSESFVFSSRLKGFLS